MGQSFSEMGQRLLPKPPVFGRLRDVLGKNNLLELRSDPSSLAPERVIVFEVAGTVENFLKAIKQVPGLEFIAELETEFTADEDFALRDKCKGKRDADRTDKAVPGRFYLAMPDLQALQQLLSLWERWERGEALGRGYAPFGHLFKQLRVLRAWGPEDRISEETIAFWQEESQQNPGRPVRTEVELWFRYSADFRTAAAQSVRQLVTDGGGQIVHEAVIPEITYHGMLIDIAAADITALIGHQVVKLAMADEIMFLRPQSVLAAPLEIEAASDASLETATSPTPTRHPIAALFDGVPLQAHHLLANRLMLDDPDNLQGQALVSRRVHGTAMASLIVHGDLNEQGPTLECPLYVRPLMVADKYGPEQTQADRLLIDTL